MHQQAKFSCALVDLRQCLLGHPAGPLIALCMAFAAMLAGVHGYGRTSAAVQCAQILYCFSCHSPVLPQVPGEQAMPCYAMQDSFVAVYRSSL